MPMKTSAAEPLQGPSVAAVNTTSEQPILHTRPKLAASLLHPGAPLSRAGAGCLPALQAARAGNLRAPDQPRHASAPAHPANGPDDRRHGSAQGLQRRDRPQHRHRRRLGGEIDVVRSGVGNAGGAEGRHAAGPAGDHGHPGERLLQTAGHPADLCHHLQQGLHDRHSLDQCHGPDPELLFLLRPHAAGNQASRPGVRCCTTWANPKYPPISSRPRASSPPRSSRS